MQTIYESKVLIFQLILFILKIQIKSAHKSWLIRVIMTVLCGQKFEVRQSERIARIDLQFDFEFASDDWHSFYTGVSGFQSSRGVASQSELEVKDFQTFGFVTLNKDYC